MKRRRLGPCQDDSLQYNMTKRINSSEAGNARKKLFVCLGLVILMFPLPVSWCFSSPRSLVWYVEYATLVVLGLFTFGYLLLFLRLKYLLSWPQAKPAASISSPSATASPAVPIPKFSPAHTPLQQFTPQNSSVVTSSTKQFYHSTPSAGGSPFLGNDCLSDLKSLDDYLKSEEEREQMLFRASPMATSTTSWTGSSSQMEVSPAVNSGYHVATRRSPGFKDDADSSGMMWDNNPFGIKEEDLDLWTERCRKWLSQTILARLVQEINFINNKLVRIGCSELQIGAVSMSTLRQIAVDKMEQVPTLGQVMPYLDITSKQDYLVHRLRELSKGDSLAGFHWNTGGMWTNRQWDQDLPTDSQIIVHLLCSYMDAHLPPNPQHPNGRVFSSRYFLKCPHRPDDKKADICIYQSQTHPPHYQLLLQDAVIDVPKGRNNLFHCIIFFLHCIDSKHNGMLGQINLGLAGINILWIISKH